MRYTLGASTCPVDRIMRRARLSLSLFAVFAALAFARPHAQAPDVIGLIDRYGRGEHDAVIAELRSIEDFDPLLEQLKRDAAGWIDGAAGDEQARRRLAAATFALEAARAAHREDWKWVRRMTRENDKPQDADHIFWKTPPLLIEWGCALLRRAGPPAPIERTWQLASIAVAQRAGDFEFLIGSPVEPRMNPGDEIDHVDHAAARFKEPRFLLATAIALDAMTWSGRRRFARPVPAKMAAMAFEGLRNDEAVGAEATMRLGGLYARLGRVKEAIDAFIKVETLTRDPYIIYLARFFRGQLVENTMRADEAERAYRGALAAVPQAQSATLALAALMTRRGRPAEAAALVEAQVATVPQPADPWKIYGAADDRFWPELIARLREGIRP